MRWSLRRSNPASPVVATSQVLPVVAPLESGAPAEPSAVAGLGVQRLAFDEWRGLRPMPRVIGPAPEVATQRQFESTLVTRQPNLYLKPLGHQVSADAPRGLVRDLATVAPPPVPLQRSAGTFLPLAPPPEGHPPSAGGPTWRTVVGVDSPAIPSTRATYADPSPPAIPVAGPSNANPAPQSSVSPSSVAQSSVSRSFAAQPFGAQSFAAEPLAAEAPPASVAPGVAPPPALPVVVARSVLASPMLSAPDPGLPRARLPAIPPAPVEATPLPSPDPAAVSSAAPAESLDPDAGLVGTVAPSVSLDGPGTVPPGPASASHDPGPPPPLAVQTTRAASSPPAPSTAPGSSPAPFSSPAPSTAPGPSPAPFSSTAPVAPATPAPTILSTASVAMGRSTSPGEAPPGAPTSPLPLAAGGDPPSASGAAAAGSAAGSDDAAEWRTSTGSGMSPPDALVDTAPAGSMEPETAPLLGANPTRPSTAASDLRSATAPGAPAQDPAGDPPPLPMVARTVDDRSVPASGLPVADPTVSGPPPGGEPSEAAGPGGGRGDPEGAVRPEAAAPRLAPLTGASSPIAVTPPAVQRSVEGAGPPSAPSPPPAAPRRARRVALGAPIAPDALPGATPSDPTPYGPPSGLAPSISQPPPSLSPTVSSVAPPLDRAVAGSGGPALADLALQRQPDSPAPSRPSALVGAPAAEGGAGTAPGGAEADVVAPLLGQVDPEVLVARSLGDAPGDSAASGGSETPAGSAAPLELGLLAAKGPTGGQEPPVEVADGWSARPAAPAVALDAPLIGSDVAWGPDVRVPGTGADSTANGVGSPAVQRSVLSTPASNGAPNPTGFAASHPPRGSGGGGGGVATTTTIPHVGRAANTRPGGPGGPAARVVARHADGSAPALGGSPASPYRDLATSPGAASWRPGTVVSLQRQATDALGDRPGGDIQRERAATNGFAGPALTPLATPPGDTAPIAALSLASAPRGAEAAIQRSAVPPEAPSAVASPVAPPPAGAPGWSSDVPTSSFTMQRAGDDSSASGDPPTPFTAASTPGTGAGSGDPNGEFDDLYERLLWRLTAELRFDRERSGHVSDMW